MKVQVKEWRQVNKDGNKSVSPLRKRYIARLIGRCVILVMCIAIFFLAPDEFEILNGLNFFKEFSIFHILWGIWLVDMICQLVPIKNHIPLGSQKLFRQRFKPIREKINVSSLKKTHYIHHKGSL